MIILVISVAILNLCDLVFTLRAVEIGYFRELNPIAAHFIHHAGHLTTFKCSVLAMASTVLLLFRRHLLTEIGCWVLLAVYSSLSVIWWMYFSHQLA